MILEKRKVTITALTAFSPLWLMELFLIPGQWLQNHETDTNTIEGLLLCSPTLKIPIV